MRIAQLVLTSLIIATASVANAQLPIGFGPIAVGQPWIEIEGKFPYQDMSDASTLPERFSQECGYKQVSMTTDKGYLLVTTNDFVVTELSLITPINPGSDLMAVADLVMQTYGQPKSAAMRTALGQATIDRQRVNYIELKYDSEHPVTFYVSGANLWEYQTKVSFVRGRWHQNKTYRCARELEKTAKQQRDPKPNS